jgi:hypothetical protein
MNDLDTVLIRTLAATDALFIPIRHWTRFHSPNRDHGLKLLSVHGVPLRIGGDDQTRKSGERTLAETAEQGYITITRRGRDKYPYLKLSFLGEARARALAKLPGRDDGRRILTEIAAKTDRKPQTLDRLWCDEVDLNGGRGWGLDATREDRAGLVDVEERYFPAANLGWLVTGSTGHGHARYRVTAAGWSELDTPSTPPDVGELPAHDPEARELYYSEQETRLAELAKTEPKRTSEIGTLPLVAAHIRVPLFADRKPVASSTSE